MSDDMVYLNVFDQLVSFDGPNSTQGVVIPSLAVNWTIVNDDNYTFNLRQGVTFYPGGDAFNATTAWFSFVRGNLMNSAIEDSNYLYVTENQSIITETNMSLPWGLLNAVQNVTGMPVTTNFQLAQTVLNNMLSNFNVQNQTIQKIMAYPYQAYIVTGPYQFVINELQPYPYLLTNIAQWWGAILDPAYIDANGGVQANTANAYFAENGGPGTGPYYIASVQTGYSTVVLKANPTYWGIGMNNLQPVMQPPKIPVIIINYGLSPNSRLEVFATNQAQISFVELPVLGQLWNAYQYKQGLTLNDLIQNFGTGPNTFFIPMNVDRFPTNNTDFRQAVVHAINYTQLLDETYGFNGTVYAQNFLGPLVQEWGPLYNPDNLSMYSYNVTLATDLLNQSGWQEDFSATLPNGTVIGNPNAPALPAITLDYIAPNSVFYETIESILQADLQQIGIPLAFQGVTSAQIATWNTPAGTPIMSLGIGWGPDWNDPILQELDEVLTPELMSGFTWLNDTQINNILAELTFNTNQTQLIQGVAQIYNITYSLAPDIWIPNYDNYMMMQPYIHGLVYSPYTTILGQFWYNTLYYTTPSS
jgi:peptide/nickel transport system substrate-binding protein